MGRLHRLAVLAALLIPGGTGAHEWYPHECCHDRDCAVVTAIERLADGGLRIATQHGVGVLPAGATMLSSPDDKARDCLRQIGPDEELTGWHVVYPFMPGRV